MKNRKALFMLPSVFIFLLLCLYPIFKIILDVNKVQNAYLSMGIIALIVAFLLLLIVLFVEEIYLIVYLLTKIKMNIFLKLLWLILLLTLNIMIIPYFYMRFITKENKIILKSFIYIIPVVIFSNIFFFGLNVYNDKITKITAERKRIEAERHEYSTKDNTITFTFRHGFKQTDVGEYDLYVINKSKNIIFTAYTYDVSLYEQKTPDDFINKGINDIKVDKEKFDIFKDKEIKTVDDKTITTIEYKGKTRDSSMCIYKISTITSSTKPNYLVYIVEVITENNYDNYQKELLEILTTSKIN